jgi:serine phosphatase RsbU (regulator of sigma subunit)/DNA-binding response OmpR family regulator
MEEVRILIVDDEPGALETLVDIFDEEGYQSETAACGRQALLKIESGFFHVALLDIRLPDMEGTDLLQRIHELHPDTACILTTAYADKESSIRALNEGAYAYIEKPLEIERVVQTIREALQKQSLQRENRRLLERLKALNDITDGALSMLELDELLDTLLQRAAVYLRAKVAVIFLVDEGSAAFSVHRAYGLSNGAGNPAASVEDTVARRVLVDGKPVVKTEVDPDDDLVGASLRERGVKSLLGVPMRARGRVIGVAYVDTDSEGGYSDEDVRLALTFADRAAMLIDNARLYDAQRRSAEEAQTLFDVAQNLAASMELQERLRAIAVHLSRLTGATRCMVGLLERDTLEVEFFDGEGGPKDQEIIDVEDLAPAMRRALDQTRPTVVRDAGAEPLTMTDPYRRRGLRSVLLLPLVYGGQIMGVLGLDEPGKLREFTPDQQRLGQLMAVQAAVAIEHARAYEQERTTARTLQESFLPEGPVAIQGFDVARRYEPAFAAAQIGGDYYDFFELGDGRFAVVMGDVCGKGVQAAVYTAAAKYGLRAYAALDPSPARVIALLNASLQGQMPEECAFLTLVYAVIDTRAGAVTYANAGHPFPLLYDPRARSFEELTATGGLVGAWPTMTYSERTLPLPKGSVLAFYTDGVTEARTGIDMLALSGVQRVIAATANRRADQIAAEILRTAIRQSGGSLSDDIAIVVLRREE